MAQFEVWFVPTEAGQRAFKWKERRVHSFTCKDDADLEAYCYQREEAPDFSDYGRYEVRATD